MAVIVQKFGGTSLGSVSRLREAARNIVAAHQRGDEVVVVVSAMAGETNRLLQLARTLSVAADGATHIEPNARELASLLTTGEHAAMALMAVYLNAQGIACLSLSAAQLPITTTQAYLDAEIVHVEAKPILTALAQKRVVVIGGFSGINPAGELTTLGRGGSDLSAVAIAHAIKATECQIFTDVDGVYTADPRLVPNAQLFECISYQQLLAFTQFGAKVVQSCAVSLASKQQVSMRILSSLTDDNSAGTLVTASPVRGDNAMLFPELGLTYQQTDVSHPSCLVSIISMNGSEINRLRQVAEAALKKAGIATLSTDTQAQRYCVEISAENLPRCLCVLHSQLGLDG